MIKMIKKIDVNIKKMIICKKRKRYPTKNRRFAFIIDFSSINKAKFQTVKLIRVLK